VLPGSTRTVRRFAVRDGKCLVTGTMRDGWLMRGLSAILAWVLAAVLGTTVLLAYPAFATPQTSTTTKAAITAAVSSSVTTGGACNGFTANASHPASYQLPGRFGIVPAAYSDSSVVVPACGPQGGSYGIAVQPYPNSLTTSGYQCVEFSRRYLYYKYGVTYNSSTNGDQMVDHYGQAYPALFTTYANGAINHAPVKGDVMSFSPIASFHASAGGHTAVVQSSTVDATGNGTLTLIEENNSASGVVQIPVSNWSTTYGSWPYTKWLHANSNSSTGGGSGTGTGTGPGPVSSPTTDGSFVSYAGRAYRMAGGAPIYISSWSVYGGSQPTYALSGTQFAGLRKQPVNGTFISETQTQHTYTIAGGAPVIVSNWSAVGGPQPTILVDPSAIAHAGSAGPWSALAAQPADGTFVKGLATGQLYRFAGGAPLSVPIAVVPKGTAILNVDQAALDRAGTGGVWNHVRFRPLDGTFLKTSSGAIYRVAGGAALHITSCQPVAFNNCAGAAAIDPTAVSNAGTSAPFSHLLAAPPNGTFIRVADGATAGGYSRAVGGALVPVPSCAPAILNGCVGAVAVNEGTLTTYAASHPGIANGTYLRVVDGSSAGQVAVAAGGALLSLATCNQPALKGCPGQVAVDTGSYVNYLVAHPIPVAGTAVKALDTGAYWSFGTDCRQPATISMAAVGVTDSAVGLYPTCISITTATLPSAAAGVGYRRALTGTGGSNHYTWTVSAGRIPTGWTLSSTGVLSGVTRINGTWSFAIKAVDADHPAVTAVRAFTTVVLPMAITTARTLPSGFHGRAYRQPLTFFGGANRHIFRIVAGHLPPGLKFSISGTVVGTPTTAGVYQVTIGLTDGSKPALVVTKTFVIRIR
jgi:hypothetical protein